MGRATRPTRSPSAFTAFREAGRGSASGNPSLHFNRGMAAKYVEDYDLALSSFEKAQKIGAAGAAEERRKVGELLDSSSRSSCGGSGGRGS